MTYPYVMSERETLQAALDGKSIARFGDGELRIALGGASISQERDLQLAFELVELARGQRRNVLTCLPNIGPAAATPRARFWAEYTSVRYTTLYRENSRYGSSFITRPDNAPWIDRPGYWQAVRELWAGKSIAYVGGDDTLLKVLYHDVKAVRIYRAPKTNAYTEIDKLTCALLNIKHDAVVIALGATGTALAARLAGDTQALDLGHIGQFMTHPGAFSHSPDDLASPEYRALLKAQHARTHWGKGGHHWAPFLVEFAKEIGAEQVLDYGCGSGTLKPALAALGMRCAEYDPGIIGKDVPPKLADIVASTDVLEHVEPEKVDAVLAHIFALARKGAFLAIAKQPAKAILNDGRNAHLSCHPDKWWLDALRRAGWTKLEVKETAWKKCLILCRK